MRTDQHPYLFIYLVGCMLVLILSMLKIAMVWLLGWITKTNVAAKNLKKIEPVDEQTFGSKAAAFIGVLALEAALSWINVVAVVWQMAVTLLKVIREALVSTPEAISCLKFRFAITRICLQKPYGPMCKHLISRLAVSLRMKMSCEIHLIACVKRIPTLIGHLR